MASTNQSPFYQKAEQNFLTAKTPEEKLKYLEEMIKECPKHKSSEKMLSNLKNRYRKLKESLEKQKKSGKSTQQGIKKAEIQAVIVGFPNSGKSSLFNILTNKNPESKVSPAAFTTYEPLLGTTIFENTKIQIIDSPPFPGHDKSLVNSTDTLLLVVDSLDQIKEAKQYLEKSIAEVITVYNKTDQLNEKEKRKIEATLKSNKINFILISTTKPDRNNIENLKKKLFETFPVIRVFTKEPKKAATKEPMILASSATVKDAAEKILKGMSNKIKRTRIWGPSSKFGGQVVGLEHKLKDKDTIEFRTK